MVVRSEPLVPGQQLPQSAQCLPEQKTLGQPVDDAAENPNRAVLCQLARGHTRRGPPHPTSQQHRTPGEERIHDQPVATNRKCLAFALVCRTRGEPSRWLPTGFCSFQCEDPRTSTPNPGCSRPHSCMLTRHDLLRHQLKFRLDKCLVIPAGLRSADRRVARGLYPFSAIGVCKSPVVHVFG